MKSSWVRKDSKKGEISVCLVSSTTFKCLSLDPGPNTQATNEFNEAMKEVESKREMIWNDLQWHCSQSYYILLQSITGALKEKGDLYDKGVANFQQFKPFLENAQKIQVL